MSFRGLISGNDHLNGHSGLSDGLPLILITCPVRVLRHQCHLEDITRLLDEDVHLQRELLHISPIYGTLIVDE